MDLFLHYAEARMGFLGEQALFRVYLTDCQKSLLESLAALAGGRTMACRYYELLAEPKEEDPRSGEEIARDVIARAGIKVIDNGSV